MLTVDFERWRVRAGERLLDLGAGGGRHTFEALRRGLWVVAGDLQEASVRDLRDMAAAMAAQGKLDPDRWGGALRCDALQLPFADGSFDRVLVSEVLEHIPDDESALREVVRVLRPGGKLAVSVPRWWPERVCWALSREYHSNDGGHVRIYRSHELRRVLEDVGLEARSSHHAHALHSPYWWLKCGFGVRKEDALVPALYHRFLVWDLTANPRPIRALERTLNPVLGKSLVVYLEKPSAARVPARV